MISCQIPHKILSFLLDIIIMLHQPEPA